MPGRKQVDNINDLLRHLNFKALIKGIRVGPQRYGKVKWQHATEVHRVYCNYGLAHGYEIDYYDRREASDVSIITNILIGLNALSLPTTKRRACEDLYYEFPMESVPGKRYRMFVAR